MHIEKSNTVNRILLVGLILLIGGQIAGCDLFSSLTDAEHVIRAKDFKDEGELRASVIELKNALQKNPKNAEARWLLGSINVELGYGSAAEKELRRGQELGIAREAMLAPLARALLMQGKNQEVLDEIGIAEKLSPTEQAKLVAFRGDALIGLRKIEKARAEYETALSIDSNCSTAKLGLARLAAKNNDLSKAQTLIAEGIKASSEDPFLWSFQGDLLSHFGDQKEAEASFTKAIELRPTNFIDRGKRALIRLERKKYADAEEDISVLKKDAPNYFQSHFAAGMLVFKQKDYKQAETDFEQTLNLNSKHPQARYYLGLAQLIQGSFEQADDHLSRFLNAHPKSISARKLLALTRFRLDKHKQAKRVLLPVLIPQSEDVYSLKLMASIEFALGNSDSGLAHLQKVAELEPDSPESRASLGFRQIITGRKEQGLRELEKAVDLDPKMSEAEAYIAFVHIRAKEFEQAEQVLNRLRKKQPDSPLPLNIEGMLNLAKNDFAGAKKSFEAAREIAPGDATASNYLARMALKNKNYAEARDILEKFLTHQPKDLATQLKLAQLDAIEGKPKDMESRLAKVMEDHPQSLEPRIALGRYYLRYGQANRVQTTLESTPSKFKSNPEILAILVEAQLAEKQPSRALNSAKTLVAKAPKSPMTHFILGKVYAANRDVKNMRKALNRSLSIDPKFFRSRLAMAKLLTLEDKKQQVEKEIESLLKEFPKNPEVLALQGWVATVQKRHRDAVSAYKEALTTREASPLVVNLARAQWAAGDKEEALETLEQWNHGHPNDALVRYVRAGFYNQSRKTSEAQRLLEEIVSENPRNVLALNDLAWLYRKTNPAKALEFAEKASKFAPNAWPIIDTLAMVKIENGQYKGALRSLEKVRKLVPKNPMVRYHLAIAQKETGQITKAIETLREVLGENPRFVKHNEAKALLDKLTRS